MTCQQMSDRMPQVLTGQSAWSAQERRHLESCGDCLAEWKIMSQVAAMGAPNLDLDAISGKVLHRLATEPVTRRRTGPLWLAGGVIAAAAILLVILRPAGPGTSVNRSESAFEIPMVELDSLSQEQLRLVLESIEEPLEMPTINEAPSMMDLDDQQLERVLRSLEG
jgi:hypothetical protein